MQKQYYAIIDIGSNTMRLVIYLREKGGRLKEVENVKAVARLRTFLESDNTLNSAGIKRLIATLQSFQDVLDNKDLIRRRGSLLRLFGSRHFYLY